MRFAAETICFVMMITFCVSMTGLCAYLTFT